jgi:hypothetical protein
MSYTIYKRNMQQKSYMRNPFSFSEQERHELEELNINRQENDIPTRETLLNEIESDLLLVNTMLKDFLQIADEQDFIIDSSLNNVNSGLHSLQKN